VQREGRGIDLVLLDYMMPKMDGEDTYCALQKIRPDIKVLVASGYGHGDKLTSLLEAGVDGFVHKPYRLSELAQILRRILDGG